MEYETNTIMGYDVNQLMHVATLLQQEGITPDMLGSYASGFIMGYDTAKLEMSNYIDKMIKEFMNNE